ncbi:YbjN domain-containing protein [Rhodospirillaceae bacterium SYSU D60014]|uniref:YbjN domain-containing protein n=1 Tax=Virgifigura deserti TaxID=2268457 RepID=UPI000E668D3E
MTTLTVEQSSPQTNPLDILEELVNANEWRFDRTTDEEMVVEISGRWCEYRLFFVWQEDLSAMYFSCLFDLRVPSQKRPAVSELLALINEKLWLGHFDLCSDELVPMFRHTILLRGVTGASVEQLEDLVDIALGECERFFPAFQYVVWGGRTAEEAVAAAMFETVGEA